jgi:DNA-binding winged helix-turn-helix (wHTH) protein
MEDGGNSKSMRLHFGECVFDPETRALLRRGKTVELSPKAFRLLQALIEKRPRAISKDELQQILWPKTFVSEGNLARLVTEVRHAIDDNAEDPHLLRTVHGFGYAFCGSADEFRDRAIDGSPKFAHRLFCGPREIALREGVNVFGRDSEVAVFLDHRSVSRHHASITVSGESAVLQDLQSKNGTFLRGNRISVPAQLSDQDDIRIGAVSMIFRSFPVVGSTETVAEE